MGCPQLLPETLEQSIDRRVSILPFEIGRLIHGTVSLRRTICNKLALLVKESGAEKKSKERLRYKPSVIRIRIRIRTS
jgi:hypothetical protein